MFELVVLLDFCFGVGWFCLLLCLLNCLFCDTLSLFLFFDTLLWFVYDVFALVVFILVLFNSWLLGWLFTFVFCFSLLCVLSCCLIAYCFVFVCLWCFFWLRSLGLSDVTCLLRGCLFWFIKLEVAYFWLCLIVIQVCLLVVTFAWLFAFDCGFYLCRLFCIWFTN